MSGYRAVGLDRDFVHQIRDPKNAYLQVRTTLYGCFLCKVERA